MKKINTLTIIGVGLIGGSIAREVKKKKLAKKIIGFGRRRSSLAKALKAKAIDEATLSFPRAVREADVVIIATPISLVSTFLKKCNKFCKAGCIITDVGSTKKKIVSSAEKIISADKFFIGTHPMAGSEKRGFISSHLNLFKDSICFLIKTKKANVKALETLELFWKKLGAKPIIVSSQNHDKIVAEVSHLPHAIATSLINSSIKSIRFASTGFRDTTRIASSNVDLWLDIFLTNKDNIVKSIDNFINNLDKIKRSIKKEDRIQLCRLLNKAKRIREKYLNP